MKKLEQVVGSLLAGLLCLALTVAPAVVRAEDAKGMPNDASGAGKHINLEFFGSAVSKHAWSTLATQITTGEGVLDGICVLGGVSGKYSLALDSGTNVAGYTHDSHTLAISPIVLTYQDTASQLSRAACWEPVRPHRFVSGLVGVANHAGHVTLYKWHRTNGGNPQ